MTGMQNYSVGLAKNYPLIYLNTGQAKNTTDGLYQITGPCKKLIYISMAIYDGFRCIFE